jgi:hypothetical protein
MHMHLIVSIDRTLQIAGLPHMRRHDFLPQLHVLELLPF